MSTYPPRVLFFFSTLQTPFGPSSVPTLPFRYPAIPLPLLQSGESLTNYFRPKNKKSSIRSCPQSFFSKKKPSSPHRQTFFIFFFFPFFFGTLLSIIVRDITLTYTGGGTPTTRSGNRRGGILGQYRHITTFGPFHLPNPPPHRTEKEERRFGSDIASRLSDPAYFAFLLLPLIRDSPARSRSAPLSTARLH